MAKTVLEPIEIEVTPTIKFRKRTDAQVRKFTEAGKPTATTYEIEIDENNHKSLKATGKKNTYAEIQSYLEETKIENILANALLGNTEALNRVESHYMDTTEMPTTLAEAQNLIIKLNTEFESLPIDIKRQFNFSPEEYVARYGTESWIETMGFKKDEVVEVTTPEETINE